MERDGEDDDDAQEDEDTLTAETTTEEKTGQDGNGEEGEARGSRAVVRTDMTMSESSSSTSDPQGTRWIEAELSALRASLHTLQQALRTPAQAAPLAQFHDDPTTTSSTHHPSSQSPTTTQTTTTTTTLPQHVAHEGEAAQALSSSFMHDYGAFIRNLSEKYHLHAGSGEEVASSGEEEANIAHDEYAASIANEKHAGDEEVSSSREDEASNNAADEANISVNMLHEAAEISCETDKEAATVPNSPEAQPGNDVTSDKVHNAPVASTAGAGGDIPDLSSLNRALRDAGFPDIDNVSTTSEQLAVMSATFADVLHQYARRGQLVQELLASIELAKGQANRMESELARLDGERVQAQKDLAGVKNALEEEKRGREQTERAAVESIKRLEGALGDSQQRCRQLEHTLKAKEKEVEKMRNVLQEAVQKEERRRAQDEKTLNQLKKDLSKEGMRVPRAPELVSIYEAQRESTAAEIASLRKEVSGLSEELRRRENDSLRKDLSSGGWLARQDKAIFERLEKAEAEARAKNAKIAKYEARAAEHESERERRVAACERRAAHLAEENANLVMELHARPTVQDLCQANARAQRLEKKLAAVLATAADGNGNHAVDGDHEGVEEDKAAVKVKAAAREPLTTSDRIRRDRDVHRLQLWKIEHLPHDVCVDLLQDACRLLELHDVFHLNAAVAKLLRVMAAVPRMEKFIGDVCQVVFEEGHQYSKAMNVEPAEAPRVLKGWLNQLAQLRELRDFHSVISMELSKRVLNKSNERVVYSHAQAAEAVRQLVDTEQSYLTQAASYDRAKACLRDEPEALVNKMVLHFMNLFGVPSLEGVFARINTVYTSNAEATNFMRALRSLLGLDAKAGPNACLSRIRTLLDEKTKDFNDLHADYRTSIKAEQLQSDDKQLPPKAERVEGEASDNTQRELMKLFGLTDESQLIPHAQRLLAKMKRLETSLPRYHKMATQLYDMLQVSSLEEIVPAVRSISSSPR
eukprot:jgi/Chlat1/561/Chrsp103S01134